MDERQLAPTVIARSPDAIREKVPDALQMYRNVQAKECPL